MKTKIILSIKLVYVKSIINGTKKYEYRKIRAKKDISSMLIYETAPTKRVVAKAEIIEVLADTPSEIWYQTEESSGTSKEFFDRYFANRDVAYAYKLGKIEVFEHPKSLKDFGIKSAPQSFVYI